VRQLCDASIHATDEVGIGLQPLHCGSVCSRISSQPHDQRHRQTQASTVRHPHAHSRQAKSHTRAHTRAHTHTQTHTHTPSHAHTSSHTHIQHRQPQHAPVPLDCSARVAFDRNSTAKGPSCSRGGASHNSQHRGGVTVCAGLADLERRVVHVAEPHDVVDGQRRRRRGREARVPLRCGL
jgi:hypothetical protein